MLGLFLVYVGAASAFYFGYPPTAQTSVKGRFQVRAWLGVVGALLSAIAAALALIAKWGAIDAMAYSSIVLMILALAWATFVTVLTATDIN